jgi:hypothetical protein
MMQAHAATTQILLLACCIGCIVAGNGWGAAIVSHSGYEGCVELSNETTRVVLCPACGGRVLEYSLNATNALYLDPAQNGWTDSPGVKPIDPYGGRFDIGPEKIVPPHPTLWLGRWDAETTGARSARLTSQADDATGVQLVRDFTLDDGSPKLTCTQTIVNVSDETRHWCHWSRTLAVGGGIVLIPLEGFSRFPSGYVMYEPGSRINFQPRDPNIRRRDGFLEVLDTPKHPKLGLGSHAGWLGYLAPNDLMFVKHFPTYPDRAYNEIAALTISIWYYRDVMCELEPIGPMETLGPGQSASFTETWWLLPHAFPSDRRAVDLQSIERLVVQQTAVMEHKREVQSALSK